MKLGDNGEAFFVEETEEEYVSPGGSHPLHTLCQAHGAHPRAERLVFMVSCVDDCCWLDKL